MQCFEKIFIQDKSRHIQNQLQIYMQGNNEARKYMRSFPSVYWGNKVSNNPNKECKTGGSIVTAQCKQQW